MYSLIGALLGIGAPLGFIAVRTLLKRKRLRISLREVLRSERAAYAYMAFATPIVFGAFGSVLGRRHESMRRAHEQSDRRHDEFSSLAAHDLRSPIATLLLRLELLRSQASEGTVNVPIETIEKLMHTGQRLSRMVNDLLDSTRIDTAKLRLDLQPTSLPDAVSALLDGLRIAVTNHGLELAVDGSPPVVMADPTRLDQIVTNLIENAAKYSPNGTPIRIEIRAERGGATIRVIDQGCGIAAEDIPRLFERYFQTEQAQRKKTGLGLGLFITKGLVDAHGGTITVESAVDRGSTFSVWLPAKSGQ
jgi:signal transduction histidine kinase